MRIKKLELIGFKSFKDRTVIQFDHGITGIVGPNGCGKSNIVDALVWVMGEMSAKHLRGASMEDVIFAGSENYAPLGLAEVSLTLENDGGAFPAQYLRHSEIMVTRRLHRSGESEYLINKEPARLKDIQEIFMDTGAGAKGFSIIEQGAIGKIITAKPEDRRVLIEEAAGITKFKIRKRESQRKIESTEQNLTRLQDIVGEQKRQLGSLERQAQRAEKFRGLKTQIQEKEVLISAKNYLSIHDEFVTVNEQLEAATNEEMQASSEFGAVEARIEEMRLEALTREKDVEGKSLQHQEAVQATAKLENEIRALTFEVEQARRSKDMTAGLLSQFQARKVAVETDLDSTSQRYQLVESEVAVATSEFEQKHRELKALQAKYSEVDEELTLKRREILTISQSESHLDARLASLEGVIKNQTESLKNSEAVLAELASQHEIFNGRRDQLFQVLEKERQMQLGIMNDVDNFKENLRLLKEQGQTKTFEVEQFKDAANKITSRLEGLEGLHASFEGFADGVKNVMLWQKKQVESHAGGGSTVVKEFYPLSEIVEVPEKFERAMEAALGPRLQLLLSEKSETALSALDYLKDQKSGRSGFLPLDLSSEARGPDADLKNEDGVVALLSDVVTSAEERFQSSVAQFLQGVAVVDSIRSALSLRARYAGWSFVTLEGDTLFADGVLTGGTAEAVESGILKRRREIKELSESKAEASGKLALAQASLKKLEGQIQAVTVDFENAKTQQSEKEIQITGLKKDLERAENELQNSLGAIARQKKEVERHQLTLQKGVDDREELIERLTEIRERKITLEATIEELNVQYRNSKGDIDQRQAEVTRLEVSLAAKSQELSGLKLQVDLLKRSLAEVTEQLTKMSEESERSGVSLSSNQVLIETRKVELERAIQRAKEAADILAQAKNAYEIGLSELRKAEEQVGKQASLRNQLRAQINELKLKVEQMRLKEQYLVDQIHERYMIRLNEFAANYRDQEADIPTLEKELADLKDKISRIGEVNLSAIEEYNELKGRYDFLTQQIADLNESKEQLKRVIDRINRICSRRFKETFEQVNDRFTKVFPVLFGGGEARLVLIEEEEGGEMGIDIIAKPPGKKLQNVSLLSGGEKALTAVSLIFSIFLVKPSPFCLLDEVDAPLDDANVSRFNDLVKEMSKRSQIIVVTHNKYTMRVNNKLYGVTMQEKGVSKMVSVSLADAEKAVAS